MVNELWSYDKERRLGDDGRRWHFVTRFLFTGDGDEPREYYFRDDDRSEYGMIRFDRMKDFPYRDYESFIRKIMNDLEYRSRYVDNNKRGLWSKSWK